jgi:aspartyl protease family protein
MPRAGTLMIAAGWLLLAGLIWWGMDGYLNPNAGLSRMTDDRGEITLKRGPDGHFRAPGEINGAPVDFLVDTGATVVALPEEVARQLGLERGPAHSVHTANGRAVAYSTRLHQLDLGGARAENVAASIVPGMTGDEALLGMSFLSRFDIAMTGDTLTLRAR